MAITRLDYVTQLPRTFATYSDINDFGDQHDDFYDSFTVEHTAGGIHDSPLLSNGAGKVTYSGGSPSLVYKSGIVSSVSSVATGRNNISLTDAATSVAGLHMDCIAQDDSAAYCFTYVTTDTSTIQVYTRDAATQSLVNVDFSFAVWSDGDPEESDATSNPLVKRNHVRICSDSVTARDDLNEFIDSHQQYYDAFTNKHNDDGVHNDDVLSRVGGAISFSGQDYTAVWDGPLDSISHPATGQIQITLLEEATERFSIHPHVTCDFVSGTTYLPSIRVISSNVFVVSLRDASDDSPADASFRFNVWYSYE